MNVDKELPSEYVSIRQVWLKNINRCSEAISNRAKPDISYEGNFQEIGNRTIVHTVNAFYHTLVDFEEATVRSDVKRYRDEKYNKNINDIWFLYKGNITEEYVKERYPELTNSWDIDKKIEELRNKKKSASHCWMENAGESVMLFDLIIQTLNKYGMLFDSQPKGYSNVSMKSV